jgi:hypothetical protein
MKLECSDWIFSISASYLRHLKCGFVTWRATKRFCGFPQSLHANAKTLPYNTQLPCFLSTHTDTLVSPYDATQFLRQQITNKVQSVCNIHIYIYCDMFRLNAIIARHQEADALPWIQAVNSQYIVSWILLDAAWQPSMADLSMPHCYNAACNKQLDRHAFYWGRPGVKQGRHNPKTVSHDPCGGWLEYFRHDPASHERWQKGNTTSNETVSYSLQYCGTWTRQWQRWQCPVALLQANYRPIHSWGRAPHKKKTANVWKIFSIEVKEKLVTGPGWWPGTRTDWPTDHRF